MYPPIASPTSPQDVPMTEFNIIDVIGTPIEASHHLQQPHLIKSTNTLRNNIDLKIELNQKRTSLKLENGNGNGVLSPSAIANDNKTPTSKRSITRHYHHQKLATVKRCSRNLDNASYRIECNNNNNYNNNDEFTESSTDDSRSECDAETKQHNGNGQCEFENRKIRRVKRKNNEKNYNTETMPDNGANKDNKNSNDMRNGNNSDTSTQKRDSVTSKEESSDDYFLCEKFKNTLNATLCDAVVTGNDKDVFPSELLSPHEGPLGRRYAEIAPMKSNKW